MIKWIKSLFVKPKDEMKPLATISAGQRWAISGSDGSPFPPKAPRGFVTILDCRNGWVRYDIGGPWRDERMEEERFRAVYSPAFMEGFE